MNLKLKEGEIFKKYYPNAIVVIGTLRLNESKNIIDIPYHIFGDTEDFNNGEKAIITDQFIVKNTILEEEKEVEGEIIPAVEKNSYDNYFGASIISSEGNYPLKLSYQYFLTLDEFSQFELNE